MQNLLSSSAERKPEKPPVGTVEEQRFTAWIRLLSAGDEPSSGDFDDVWTLLRHWVRRALQRRGMWDRRPIYLGIVGSGSWVRHDTADDEGVPKGGTRDALDELVHEVYVEVFVKRLPTLSRYVKRGRTVEAVVRRAIDQAIHERQSARDPLGQRLYQWLRSAAQMGIDRGLITLLDGGAKIQSASVLHIGGMQPDGPSAIADLDVHIRLWNDDLFVDWLTAKGRESEQVVARLSDLLLDLPRHGIDIVRFEVLVKALTLDTRSRLAVLFQDWQPLARIWSTGEADADSEHPGAWDDPRLVEEARDRFQARAGCVEQRIDGVHAQRRTREQLRRLWRLLGVWARAAATGPGSSRDCGFSDLFSGDGFPSDRELGRLLSLRHDRVKDLMITLKREIRPCLESTQGKNLANLATSVFDSSPDLDLDSDLDSDLERSKEPLHMSPSGDFRQQLLARSVAAARGHGQSGVVEISATGSSLEVGQLWDFGPSSGADAEWLILDADGDRKLLVPVDGEPWQGSRDVRPQVEPPFEGLVARMGLGFWTAASVLPGTRSATWAQDVLEPLRKYRSRVLDGVSEASANAQEGAHEGTYDDVHDDAWETDVDPDYQLWVRALDQDRRRWVAELGGELDYAFQAEAFQAEPATRVERLVAPSTVEQKLQDSKPPKPIPWVAHDELGFDVVAESSPGWGPSVRSLAMAASILVAVGAGMLVGRLLDDPQLDPRWTQAEELRQQLEAENQELRQDLGDLEAQSEQSQQQSQQRLDELKTQTEAQITEMLQTFENRLEELDGPELVTGWLFVPPGTTRGDGDTLTLDPQSRSVMIQAPAMNGDRIRLLRVTRAAGSSAPKLDLIRELEVSGVARHGDWAWRVPRRLLPTGQFMVEVVRDGESVIRYRFQVTEPQDEEDIWP